MAAVISKADYREKAFLLGTLAQSMAYTDPARIVADLEAILHAMLAITAPTAAQAAAARAPRKPAKSAE